jgi:hypothetical protein
MPMTRRRVRIAMEACISLAGDLNFIAGSQGRRPWPRRTGGWWGGLS